MTSDLVTVAPLTVMVGPSILISEVFAVQGVGELAGFELIRSRQRRRGRDRGGMAAKALSLFFGLEDGCISRVSGGSLAKASLVGAKTVKGPFPLRASTRPAAWTALTRVVTLAMPGPVATSTMSPWVAMGPAAMAVGAVDENIERAAESQRAGGDDEGQDVGERAFHGDFLPTGSVIEDGVVRHDRAVRSCATDASIRRWMRRWIWNFACFLPEK